MDRNSKSNADGPAVLLIDDEARARLSLTANLGRSGFRVESSGSGQEALQMFCGGRHAVVVAANRLPDISAEDLLNRLKNLAPQVPVILLAEGARVEDAVSAMKAGASDYLLRPCGPEMISAAVKRVWPGNNGGSGSQTTDSAAAVDPERRIITRNPAMLELMELARSVAPSAASVLILGESGTGKELLARHIHLHSPRRDKAFVAMNCAALPENLAESELFGHEKGTFTGAVARKLGKFERADGGTILLDEISEMALPLQAKLLRVLQEREIDRIGGERPVKIDVRLIAISNRDLQGEAAEGRFREDLFYRLNVIPLKLPPLRDRREDIAPLVAHFAAKFCRQNGRAEVRVTAQAMQRLENHPWKGNIRELENTIERAVLLSGGKDLDVGHMFLEPKGHNAAPAFKPVAGMSVREMEKELIGRTLSAVNNNRTHAAEMLGISIRTLRNKLNEYKELS